MLRPPRRPPLAPLDEREETLESMANALKFHAVVQGKTLPLPDLSQFEGKRVEVLLVEDEREGSVVVPAGDESPRPLGLLRGQLRIPSDFDAPLPDEVLRLFEGDA